MANGESSITGKRYPEVMVQGGVSGALVMVFVEDPTISRMLIGIRTKGIIAPSGRLEAG